MCAVMGPAPSFVLTVIIKPSSVTKLTGECAFVGKVERRAVEGWGGGGTRIAMSIRPSVRVYPALTRRYLLNRSTFYNHTEAFITKLRLL